MKENDKLRYSRISDILELLIEMQSNVLGITLSDIQSKFNVSRRTAERLRDAILCVFPQIDEIEEAEGKEKHWGFTGGYLNEFVHFSPDEIATLESVKDSLKYKDKKQTLDSVITKLKAISRKNILDIEDAIEIMLRSEGVAVTQKPDYKVDSSILETVRKAIKENRKIKVLYRGKNKKLSPYGIIFGSKIHLVAKEHNSEHPYNYLMHKLANVELTNDTFDKGDFNIKDYANRSFGIYQNKPIKVELLFDKIVREDVLNHNFHPTQKIKENPDGTISVKFSASGSHEIIWHLFKWSDNFKLISPKSLKDEYIDWLQRSLLKQIGK